MDFHLIMTLSRHIFHQQCISTSQHLLLLSLCKALGIPSFSRRSNVLELTIKPFIYSWF